MPRLKLGGQRAPAPRFPSPSTNGMMTMNHGMMGFQHDPHGPMGQMMMSGHQQPLGLPVIAGTMSLRPLRPRGPSHMQPRGLQAKPPARAPFNPSRPLQVRTVFVPPPMRMKGTGPHKPNPGPKVISSFPLSIPGLPAPISITPLSNGKSHTPVSAPVIKGLEMNGSTASRTVDEYEDIELDDDDDGVDENDDEFNDIQESGTVILDGEPVVEEPPGLMVGGPASLRASVEALDPMQRAKKTFRVEKPADSQETDAKTKKRSFDSTATQNGTESVKRPRLVTEGPKEASNEKAHEVALFAKAMPRCLCSEAPLLEQGGEVCGAVEVVGGHRVGCRNKVVRRGLIRTCRQQTSLPVVMCELHRRRFAGHAACPLCGEFCTHGLVYMCRPGRAEQPHLFHRGCYNQKPKEERACPHCGTRRTPLAVQLKMGMGHTQLKFLHFTSKMTMQTKPPGMDKEQLPRWDSGKKRERQVQYKLPNGKILSADILPDGLEAERLEEVIKGFENKATAKCTTRNMYVPTSAGDNVKLLQLLALDYSPSQKFPEADGGTPLHVAAGGNHTLTAHILVQAGAEINAFDDNNETPLMIAAYNGYPAMTRYLITTGAKLELKSDDGMTALHLATQNGHLECAHIILGSNKLPRNHINVKDDGGWTPLVWACEHKHEPVIRFLLEQGCDLFSTDVEMNVAMHWAAFSGSKSIVELLLAAGSDVNVTNGIGETPLHIALRQDHYECALLLVTRGARLDIQNQQGQLPAQCLSDDAPRKATSLLQLGTTLQKLMSERKQKFLTEKTVCQDISNAKETIPVTAVNGEDLEQGPAGYVYVRSNVVTLPLPIDRNIEKLEHCECKDNCTNEESCKCSENSIRSWYDQSGVLKEGFDFTDPPMIFECNDMCSCNVTSCNNRVVQYGISYRMQVYKTYGMGWGVKSLTDIPKGGFVCEYVGELISDAEAEERENDSYLFDLENRDGDTFCIDANKFGNVTRFINHSCAPNLVPVKVFTNHQDIRFPHIAMFASKDIKKGDVLGFDYGEKFWVIKHKEFTCWCGLEKCKYSKTAIGKTLEAYYKKIEQNKSPVEEEQRQTGKLKLKLKMEEGKVVKVDDSGLLPDEPGRKTPAIERTNRKSTDSKEDLLPRRSKEEKEERKAKKAIKEAVKEASKEAFKDVMQEEHTPTQSVLPVRRINLLNDFPSDEKKLKCSHCPEFFKTSVGLANHVRTHTECSSTNSEEGKEEEAITTDMVEDIDVDNKEDKHTDEKSAKEGSVTKMEVENIIMSNEHTPTKADTCTKSDNNDSIKTGQEHIVTTDVEFNIEEQKSAEEQLKERLRAKFGVEENNAKSDQTTKMTLAKEEVGDGPSGEDTMEGRIKEEEIKTDTICKNGVKDDTLKEITSNDKIPVKSSETVDGTGDIIDGIKNAVVDGVVGLEMADNENISSFAKFFCCKCQKGFSRDDELMSHQAECRKSPAKAESLDKIECKNCKMKFNREAKLIFHQTKCKASDDKKPDTVVRTIPDLIAIDKKLPPSGEEMADSLLPDMKSLDRDSTTSSPLPPGRKARGRPRKASLPTPEPIPVEHLSILPASTGRVSARTSSSSRTSVAESPGSRPKRSRKATDKPDL